MNAEILRRAASLMRERAEGAVESIPPACPEWHSVDALMAHGKTAGDAEHIASWHPAVALAVADWLEVQADDGWTGESLAVASAYLGESA